MQEATRLCAHPALPFFASGGVGAQVALWRADASVASAEYHQRGSVGHGTSLATGKRITRVRFNEQGLSLAACDESGSLWVWQTLRPSVVSHSIKVRGRCVHAGVLFRMACFALHGDTY